MADAMRDLCPKENEPTERRRVMETRVNSKISADARGPTLQVLVDSMKRGAEEIGRGLGPGGDWCPCLATVNTKGEVTHHAIDPAFLADGESKDKLASVLWRTVWEEDVILAVFVSSNWLRTIPADELVERREEYDRTETLCVVGLSIDAERLLGLAPITRDANEQPTLGAWEDLPLDVADKFEGRFTDPLATALELKRQIACGEKDEALRALRAILPKELHDVVDDDAVEAMSIRRWWREREASR